MIKFGSSGKKWRIGLVGCGTVGKGLLSLLNEKRDFLKSEFDFDFDFCLICDYARGTITSKSGLELGEILKNLDENGDLSDLPGATFGSIPLEDLLRETPVDILCEATPTNYETGQPSKGILQTALRYGANVVTCSKGGVGLDLEGLKALALENGAKIRFESSVLSGTPLISLVRSNLAGCSISRVEGIVNGTTNYILSRMTEGMDYESALKKAQELGYAESDPTGDVEGFDAAVKVCIMAQEFFHKHLRMADIDRRGITEISLEDVRKAESEGKRIKLIAGVECKDGVVRGYAEPRAIDRTHPLASVMDATNAVCISTDNLGDITIIGPGAGARETAQGLLSDMLEIALAR